MTATTKLTLGPVAYNWPNERWRDFYFRVADEAPVDSVCIGEVVCSKRLPSRLEVLPDVVERLQAAGKQVVHATLALIMTDAEMAAIRDLAADEALFVEANDISACALLAGRPHAVGPLVNVYNEGTLAYLARNGAVRVSLPGELPAESIAVLAAAGATEIEVQVFGRLPLAISARCYHARHHNLAKDSCQFVCGDDPCELDVEDLGGQSFVVVNGTQTLSASYVNLIGALPDLLRMGVERFRLAPERADIVSIASAFRGVLDGSLSSEDGMARLGNLCGDVAFADGFFRGGPGRTGVGIGTGADRNTSLQT